MNTKNLSAQRLGANKERTAILAHVRRLAKKGALNAKELIAWLLGRNERYNKRTGGL